jgi:hypothetical protein
MAFSSLTNDEGKILTFVLSGDMSPSDMVTGSELSRLALKKLALPTRRNPRLTPKAHMVCTLKSIHQGGTGTVRTMGRKGCGLIALSARSWIAP